MKGFAMWTILKTTIILHYIFGYAVLLLISRAEKILQILVEDFNT